MIIECRMIFACLTTPRNHGSAIVASKYATPVAGAPAPLYQVEHASADLDPDGRRVLRREQSVPLVTQIDDVRQVSRGPSSRSRPWEMLSAISRINGRCCNALSRMAGSRSTITAPRISSASSLLVGRIGSSR